ncbi:unnamed protein product [Callosobruchus maculatus]|uniref:Tripeptidyl peptidase II C-terminal domain-containing protein n=1 Tax=Callosobruchus maculatus TaxID=64391 RepID=A0A653CJE6_CALMS|nr:unnamed protein product [Callosobruchus maculatus]
MDGISTKKSSNGNTSEKSKQEEYNDALRDLKTQWLSKMEASVASSMYEELTTQYPDHSVVHSAYLQVIDPLDKRYFPDLPTLAKPKICRE